MEKTTCQCPCALYKQDNAGPKINAEIRAFLRVLESVGKTRAFPYHATRHLLERIYWLLGEMLGKNAVSTPADTSEAEGVRG